MLMHGSFLVGADSDPQHAHLLILTLHFVMFRIPSYRIERSAHRLSRSRLLQFDLNNVERVVGKHLTRMHPFRNAPHYLARLPVEDSLLPAVLIGKLLSSRLEINHDAV